MKIYSVSIMAFNLSQPDGSKDFTYIEHLPGMVPAESIEDAAEVAKKQALERWKPEDGWYSHQACIQPVTVAFCEAYEQAFDAGTLSTSDDEQPQCFKFETELDGSILI